MTTTNRLHWHQERGHACILVSASLDVYLTPWAREMGFDSCITPSLETDASGRVNGKLSGGNCFVDEKVRRIKEWLDGKVLTYSYAYGDSLGDLPMLNMVNEGYMFTNKNADSKTKCNFYRI